MKKVLWILSITSGILCVVSAVVLGCIYLENIAGTIKTLKSKVFDKLTFKKRLVDDGFDY